MKLAIALAAGMTMTAAAQDAPKKQDPAQAHAKVDQNRVDKAIKKGVEFLKAAAPGKTKHGTKEILWDELVLLTYVHAGVAEDDPAFEKLFKSMMERELEHTYEVSLQAMILEELDRVKYQDRIAQCAQFLVDNQCVNGQWSYGEPSPFVKDVPTGGDGGRRKDVAAGGGEKKGSTATSVREKPPVTKKIPIKKRRDGPLTGDNSNSQYAALGLRACADAGIQFPNAVLNAGALWWRNSQKPDKNKGGYKAEGWCYGPKEHADHAAYGSMTAGAVGSLVIYDYLLKDNWKADKDVANGLQWLAENFKITETPGPCEHGGGKPEMFLYYWLYALERAGILYGTETFGGHEWYPTGANWLLDNQVKDGSWGASAGSNKVWDTCFAILFLRRATRPLEEVASGKVGK